jgi:hypothetical protein
MIPPCPSGEEYRSQSEGWRLRALSVEDQFRNSKLEDAYTEIDETTEELHFLQDLLAGCSDCCEYNRRLRETAPPPSGVLQSQHVRGADIHRSDQLVERHGVRRMRSMSRRSEF